LHLSRWAKETFGRLKEYPFFHPYGPDQSNICPTIRYHTSSKRTVVKCPFSG